MDEATSPPETPSVERADRAPESIPALRDTVGQRVTSRRARAATADPPPNEEETAQSEEEETAPTAARSRRRRSPEPSGTTEEAVVDTRGQSRPERIGGMLIDTGGDDETRVPTRSAGALRSGDTLLAQ